MQEHHPPGLFSNRVAVRMRLTRIEFTGYRVAGGLAVGRLGDVRVEHRAQIAVSSLAKQLAPDVVVG